MNYLRNVFGYFMVAAVLAAFALPTTAGSPQKIFSLTMAGGPVTAGASGVALTAIYTNQSPGNSVINSLILTSPSGMTITGATTAMGGTLVVNPGGGSVSVTNMPGISAGGNTWSMTVTVTIAAAPGCTSDTFSAQAFTGNSLGGTPFAYQPQLSSPTIGVTAGCQLRFVSGRQPQNSLASPVIITSTPFNESPADQFVQVELVDANNVRSSGFDGSSVALAQAGGTGIGTVAGNTATLSGGLTTFNGLSISAAGTYVLKPTSQVAGLAGTPSSQFTIVAPEGILNCAPTTPYQFGDTSAGGSREAYNKDGSPCFAVEYLFTNNIANTNTVSLTWDTGFQPNAAFSYSATWKPEAVDPTTGLPPVPPNPNSHRTLVAFQFDSLGNPLYSFGVACLTASPPTPYGALKTAIGTSETSIEITGANLPTGIDPNTGNPVTFPVIIGPPLPGSTTPERMQATWSSGTSSDSIYVVQRMTGGTPIAGHAAGAPVMSTPLPIDPNQFLAPPNGNITNGAWMKQAPMCIWDEAWTSVRAGFVQFTTSVFDIGDGYVSRQ